MEFHEKLQELRKSRGMTQEELAEALYVSRTAVSKWESGRGYPNLESLKEISNFFSISIDDLLSVDALFDIAENDRKTDLRKSCDFMLGIMDLCFVLLIILPLYPNAVGNHVYAVNLITYTGNSPENALICGSLFGLLTVLGIMKTVSAKRGTDKNTVAVTAVSMILTMLAVMLLIISRAVYAAVLAFIILLIKGLLVYRRAS